MRARTGIMAMLLAAGTAGVVGYFAFRVPRGQTPATLPEAGTQPSRPTATPPIEPPPRAIARQLVDLVLAQDPHFPTTQPLAIPGTLADAARINLKEPVYLCPRRDLWITHAESDPTPQVLTRADDEQTHILHERVKFAHWIVDDDTGKGRVLLIVENVPGQIEVLSDADRKPLSVPPGVAWESAASWKDRIIVPDESGVAVIQPNSGKIDRAEMSGGGERPQFAFDPRGVIAWRAPREQTGGGDAVYRYVDGAWQRLTAPGWSGKILHVIPLLDGSALVLRINENGSAGVTLTQIEGDATQVGATVEVDEQRIAQLVDKLSDRDPIVREQAFAELARFGAGAFAVLQKLQDQQPPGARLMIADLLNAKLEQRLGTLRLENGPLEVISRFDDGGRVYHASAGVSVFSENVGPQLIEPAYIAVRPGRAVRLLPPLLVEDFAPQRQQMVVIADEWFITDDITGPRRFIGNHFQTVLRRNEMQFWQVLGVDRRGRWYYTDPPRSGTLVIDPTLPNPIPRLIVWEYPVRKGEVGWTTEDWPAVKRPGAWALHETDWRPLAEGKDRFITEWTPPASDAGDPPSTGQASTGPSSRPEISLGALILREKSGTRWHDGIDHLQCVRPDGSVLDWELPGVAVGGGRAQLFRVGERRLLLFNQTGRVVAIRETPQAAEPFKVETIFTDRIPDTDSARRIWQDPAGRIIAAIDDTLWIMFPDGKVPESIQNMMPPGLMRQTE